MTALVAQRANEVSQQLVHVPLFSTRANHQLVFPPRAADSCLVPAPAEDEQGVRFRVAETAQRVKSGAVSAVGRGRQEHDIRRKRGNGRDRLVSIAAGCDAVSLVHHDDIPRRASGSPTASPGA